MRNVIDIKDINDEKLDIFARTKESALMHINEPDYGLFIAESPRVILRAIEAGYEAQSFLIEEDYREPLLEQILEKSPAATIYQAPFEVLTKITGYKLVRGMLASMKRRKPLCAEEIYTKYKRVAVIENVVNPTNIGAITRSAAALNMDAVIFTAGCSDPLYRRAARVSMGSVFLIPWTKVSDNYCYQSIIPKLKANGFKVAAMALKKDSVDIDDKELSDSDKIAIVLGTEGDGLAEETINMCDYTVCIPMAHEVDSLNVAAASAVAFWQIGRRNRE